MEAVSFLIETKRLGLRQMGPRDRAAIAAMLRDPLVMQAWEHAFSEAEVTQWIEKRMAEYELYGNFGYWAMVSKETGQVIGQCGITMQDGGPLGMVPEVGYMLARAYWHQGYGLEAARAARDYGFQKLGFPAMYSIIRDNNRPSLHLAERNGMHPMGRVVKMYRSQAMPHIVCGIRRDEWIQIEKENGRQ